MSYPSFSAGDVLTAADMNAVGLWLVKTQTVGSAVSSVTVTSAFSADFDNYKITYTGGTGSTQQDLRIQLGSTTTGYASLLIYSGWVDTPTISLAGEDNGASWLYPGGSSTEGAYMNCDILVPYLSMRTTISAPFVAASTGRSGGFFTGYLANTTSYTAFTLSPNTGTITGGTIRVYGYRN